MMAIDTIVTNAIANDAVTAAKIPAGAVNFADIADGSITTSKIATDNAVQLQSKLATSGALPALNGSALTGVEGNLVLLNTTTISSATAEVALQIFLMMHMKLL